MANRKITKWSIDVPLILKLMHERGLSIHRLAKEPLVDRNERTIRTYFKEKHMPPGILKGIAEVLKVNPELLIDCFGTCTLEEE